MRTSYFGNGDIYILRLTTRSNQALKGVRIMYKNFYGAIIKEDDQISCNGQLIIKWLSYWVQFDV